MKIGVDVDGVLTNLEEFQLKYGKKYFKNIKEDQINVQEIDIKEIFNCTKDEREKFWVRYIWKYCFMPFEEDMSALIRKLKSEGDEIYIITGRAHTTEQNITGKLFRKMLFHMLEKEGVPYDHIFFCSEQNSANEKLEICKKNNIDILIDDKKENLEAAKSITRVICRDRIYNRMYNDSNIVRARNTNEIYDEIQKIKNPDYFIQLSYEEVSKMDNEEKIIYYKKLKEYYSSLPFDDGKIIKTEKNYKNMARVALPIYNLFAKPEVFNRNLVPDEDGVMYVANHNNYYDQFPIISAINDQRPIHFLTATKMLNMKRGGIYLKTGAVSIDRENPDDRKYAKEQIIKLLCHGKNVFIFPEGRTNRGEDFLLPFHLGAASIARDCGCKIVPIAVNYGSGLRDSYVRFGESITVSPTEDIVEATENIKNIIGDLKQENINYLSEKTNKSLIKSKK